MQFSWSSYIKLYLPMTVWTVSTTEYIIVIYHRSFLKQEKLYLEHSSVPTEEQDISILHNRLIELLNFQLHKQQAKTKDQLAVELIGWNPALQMLMLLRAVCLTHW